MGHSDLITQLHSSIEEDLKSSLQPLLGEFAHPIGEMVAYHMGWNPSGAEGKRIRPLFTLLCCGAINGAWQHALPAASAIEWIHNFSLIHDDIQDQSATRRGRETIWTRTGIAQAINTGDAIFALSRLTTQRLVDLGIPSEVIIRVHRLLDQACLDLTIGQHLDMDYEQRTSVEVDEYLEMITRKTGALVYAACASGAAIGGAEEAQLSLLGEFGRNVGLAFQMYDDLLGIWGDSSSTGKPAGDDIRSRKKTLPILYGVETSKQVRTLWEQSPRNESQIQIMVQALEEAGAESYVLDLANSYTQLALSCLQQAQPLQPYADQLEALAVQLLQREH